MSLPIELIDKILILVPVKYLLRCRCVSKEWCSLIDSNEFVKNHFKKTIECKPDGGVIIRGGREIFLTDFDCLSEDNNVDVLEMKSVPGFEIVGIANGLVCLSKDFLQGFVVCNPSTRKFREIPCFMSFLCGFGYDHVNDDYKFVKIVQYQVTEKKEVEVYSLKSNSWKRIQEIGGNVSFLPSWGTFVGGALYWIAFKFPSGSPIIFHFDFQLEQFKEFPTPDVNLIYGLGHVGQSLYIRNYENSYTNIWLMNNHGAENPWYKAFSMEQPDAFVELIAFSKTGKDVLIEVNNRELLWYDLETKTVKNVQIQGIPITSEAHLYTESLFQLTECKQLQ